MTIFAGAFRLRDDRALPEGLKDQLRQQLRHQDAAAFGQRFEREAPGFMLVAWDSGALGEPAWYDTTADVAALAGDPLWGTATQGAKSRIEQLRQLAPPSMPLDDGRLAESRGSFALARYERHVRQLQLATDAIGVRSVYYTEQDGVLLFATALRILESMPAVKKRLCTQAMTELTALSFPLADRSPYQGIKILRESEMLHADANGLRICRYFDWTEQPAVAQTKDQAARGLSLIFRDAVRVRAGADKCVYSFLSGGMDSRAIVATLVENGCQIEALNFSPDNSQDQRYAQRLCALIPQHCRLHCLQGGIFPNFSFLARSAKSKLEAREAIQVDRPQVLWSGDGGSVGLGHVYMDEVLIELAESKGLDAALDYFLSFNRTALHNGVLRSIPRKQLPDQLRQSLLEEINRYPRKDLGRRFYLFLLFNDQRRHLFKHFETIDRHGLELLTPFYDATFLKSIAALPSKWGVLHRLYAQWFDLLPNFARQTPWQTYPGHVACPLPADQTATYQWDGRGMARKARLGQRWRESAELMRRVRSGPAAEIYDVTRVGLAAVLHVIGLRDCSHILTGLRIYCSHAANTTS